MGSYRENDLVYTTSTPLPAKDSKNLSYGNIIMGMGDDGKAHMLKATQNTSGEWVLESTAVISGDVNIDSTAIDTSGYIGKDSSSNGDFDVAYTSGTTITFSNLPDEITAFTADDIVSVMQVAADGSVTEEYVKSKNKATFTMSGDVLTVDGASFESDDTFIVYTNVAKPVSGGGGGGGSSTAQAEYKSPDDFTATYTSPTTITLSSLPFTITDSSQLAYIKTVPATGDAFVLINGADGVTMTVSSNVVTVSGASDIFASGDVYEVGINSQKKSYDPSTQSMKQSNLNPVWSRYTDTETLVTAQDLTASYADFGAEIDMTGYTHLRVAIVTDVNSSENITLKLLGLDEIGGSDEYEIEGGTTQAISHAADGKYSYTFDVKATPVIQLQAVAGTVGATAGDLTISINKIWKGGN